MDRLTGEEAQAKLPMVIDMAVKNQNKFLITSKDGNVVLLSEESYNNLLITLELFSAPLFLEEQEFCATANNPIE